MNNLENALNIALHAHSGQKDKSGKAYILHPLRLMHQAKTEEEKITALLHDVVEDSTYSLEDLINEGFSNTIIRALGCLTKRKNEKYENFISRVKTNDLAARVKILDIEDNINTLRLNTLCEKDLARVAKYHKAWHRLKSTNSLRKNNENY